jgi:hypothetical protein
MAPIPSIQKKSGSTPGKKYVSSHEVSRKNGSIDSSVYINIFDEKGNIKRTMTRWFSEAWCDSSLYSGGG